MFHVTLTLHLNIRQKSRIKPPYRVEDEAVLPESPHQKITSSKIPPGSARAVLTLRRL